MNKIFVDTDVIMDFLTDREPFSTSAAIIFNLCVESKLTIYVSAISIQNTYYVLKRVIGHLTILKAIEGLLGIVDVAVTKKEDLLEAISGGFKDFEDGVQHETALRIKNLTCIITRNVKDYRNSRLPVFTPESFLSTL